MVLKAASRTAVACGLMIAATLAIFLVVDRLGAGLVAPLPSSPPSPYTVPPHSTEMLAPVLLALLVVILTARSVGAVFGLAAPAPSDR